MWRYEKDPSLAHSIINHVPSTEEIRAARQIEATHNPDDAMSREMVDLILLGSGVQVERRNPGQVPAAIPIAKPKFEAPASEQFIESEFERTLTGAEHRKLLEELAKSGE